MGRSIAVSVLVAIVCAIIIWGPGRLLDSSTLSSVAIAGGAGRGVGIHHHAYPGRSRSGPRTGQVGRKTLPLVDRAGWQCEGDGDSKCALAPAIVLVPGTVAPQAAGTGRPPRWQPSPIAARFAS